MLKIKYIFFLVLISFTLQFEHCFQTSKICKKMIPTPSGSITNCIEYNDRTCKKCDIGYAVSSDGNECIQFSYCKSLDEGNQQCDECIDGYYLNGKECTKIPIDNCLSLNEDGDKCSECAAYSLTIEDGSRCQLIEHRVEGCKEYDNNGNCKTCESLYTISGSGSSTTCTFNDCPGDEVVDYCLHCQIGYYRDTSDGNCKPYNTENYSKRNKIGCAFLILMLSLLI